MTINDISKQQIRLGILFLFRTCKFVCFILTKRPSLQWNILRILFLSCDFCEAKCFQRSVETHFLSKMYLLWIILNFIRLSNETDTQRTTEKSEEAIRLLGILLYACQQPCYTWCTNKITGSLCILICIFSARFFFQPILLICKCTVDSYLLCIAYCVQRYI